MEPFQRGGASLFSGGKKRSTHLTALHTSYRWHNRKKKHPHLTSLSSIVPMRRVLVRTNQNPGNMRSPSQVPRTSSKWVGEPDWRSPNQSSCALNINVAADWVMVTFVGMREKARGQVVGKPIPISQGKQRGPRRTIYMWLWSYIRIPFRGSPEIWPGLCLSLWGNFA